MVQGESGIKNSPTAGGTSGEIGSFVQPKLYHMVQGVARLKLKRATYRHIEAEIYAYHDTLEAVRQLRQEIMYSERQEEQVKVSGGGYISNSIVERRATRLADSILLREMERITEAIRKTYERSKEEGRSVVWVKYGLALNWEPPLNIKEKMRGKNRFDTGPDEMAKILSVDRATFHRYRTGFVYGIAERLGWY